VLRQQGWKVGENRVARLMRHHGIVGLQKRRFRSKTAAAGPLRAPNRLSELGQPNRPDQAWVADITYTQRLHSSLGFKSPNQFEEEHLYKTQSKSK
jgi:transposase InsO family protein